MPGESLVFRAGGISYLRIPAPDPARAADFYEAAFGWAVRRDRDEPAFEDGFLPYVYVERVDDALGAAAANGGEVVTPPYPEGDLWVATFRDPAGNVIGVWQRGPRG